MRTALITGVTGQDGACLAESLLENGYTVHGIKRRASLFKTDRVDHLCADPHESDVHFFMHYGDMTDATNLIRDIQETQPDEIYNLAAQSHVQVSFETPEYAANADALGMLRLLEAMRILGMVERCRFYRASTSEMFGLAQEVPQRETTPFYPRSPYGAAKACAYWIAVNQHEGALARARKERGGNNGAAGAAVIAPGDVVVRADPRYYRPTEMASLLGDVSKARDRLGWTPRIGFEELVSEMVGEDLDQALRIGALRKEGLVVREPCE